MEKMRMKRVEEKVKLIKESPSCGGVCFCLHSPAIWSRAATGDSPTSSSSSSLFLFSSLLFLL